MKGIIFCERNKEIKYARPKLELGSEGKLSF